MSNFTRTQEISTQQKSSQSADKMNHYSKMEFISPITMTTLSRSQERVELQQLNDRFAAYVQHVRQLAERSSQVDSTAVLKSTKTMEVEIHNLKNMYEQELEKLRKELESYSHEKSTYQVQMNKQIQCASEFQERLKTEAEKNAQLMDEINAYQRRIAVLEAEIQDLKIAASRPRAELEQLQRSVSNLTRENETLKHRYEHEQVARQEAETRIQQIIQKSEFNEKVSAERMGELTSRVEMSAATILSLEAKVRDQSKTDISVSELLKQVRETAEAELRKYQIESEEQYNRNLTVLKTQLDIDAKNVEKLEVERSQLRGSLGEFQAKIRNLEGQVANLEHQKRTLEDTVSVERSRAADNVRSLETKLREVQEMLVVKMQEVTTTREQNIPLMAEIEALKALMEEEEKRLRLALAAGSATTIAAGAGGEASAYMSSTYNATTSSTSNTAAATSTALNVLTNSSATAYPSLPPANANYNSLLAISSTPHAHLPLATSDTVHNTVTFADETQPYAPSPPLSVTYIPESLQPMGVTGTSIDPMFTFPQFEDELDPHLFGYTGSRPVDKSTYEASPGLNLASVDPSPPATPRSAVPAGRAKSAPAERHRALNLVRSDIGQGHDYFDKMFHDLQQDTLYHRTRPKSSPQQNDQPLSSVYRDYAVSTSSATGDVKIMEVQQDGKYVRLVNDGSQEIDFGGYMIQQNVGGHPVAVFRFPPRTKVPAKSAVTVYAGTNACKQHNPPHDFVWKEQQKWGSGPECTTILCRANGQAVAWTTAAHRFSHDTFLDGQTEQKGGNKAAEEKPVDDAADDDSLAEANANGNASKTEAVSLRREKQQPPSLHVNGNAYGSSGGQSRVVYHVNNGNCQTSCPELVPVQKAGTTVQRKYVSGISTQQASGTRGNGKSFWY